MEPGTTLRGFLVGLTERDLRLLDEARWTCHRLATLQGRSQDCFEALRIEMIKKHEYFEANSSILEELARRTDSRFNKYVLY